MSNRLSLRLLFQVLALLLLSVAAVTPIAATSVESQQSLDSAQLTQAGTVRDLIEERGRVRVIVSIDSLGQPDGSLSGQAIARLSARSARVGRLPIFKTEC